MPVVWVSATSEKVALTSTLFNVLHHGPLRLRLSSICRSTTFMRAKNPADKRRSDQFGFA